MKFRTHEAGLLGLIVGLLCICAAGSASAQDFFPPPWSPTEMQPPFMAPTQPSTSRGLFYVSAGVRFRNINTFRFDSVVHYVSYVNPGTPPFGPDDPSVQQAPFGSLTFGTGTGRTGTQAYPTAPAGAPPGDPRLTGIWVYQNGTIDPGDPGPFPDVICDIGPPAINCGGGGSGPWPDPAFPGEQLGRIVVVHSTSGNCCDGITLPHPIGQFILLDPTGQANSASIAGTTALSFTRVIDGTYNASVPGGATSNEVASMVFRFSGGLFANQEFGANPGRRRSRRGCSTRITSTSSVVFRFTDCPTPHPRRS